MYVGDDSGVLHKFTGVFNGTPAEITGGGTASGWPQTMTGGGILTSPVLDATDGMVFVAGSGGFLFRIPPGGGSTNLVISGQLAVTGSTGIVDAPIVDNTPSTPEVYVMVGDNNQNAGRGSVDRFPPTFPAASLGTFVTIGTGVTTTAIYDGDFDNIHYSGSGSTGSFYVCGYHGSGTIPRLFEVDIATFTGTPTTIGTIAGTHGTCSPVTEFLNTGSGGAAVTTLSAAITTVGQTAVSVTSGTNIGTGRYIQVGTEDMQVTAGGGTSSLTVTRGALGTTAATHFVTSNVLIPQLDWMYMSTTAGGSPVTGCTTGDCIYDYEISTALVATSAPTAALVATGGTSGIIIDNSTITAGESQIYYTTLANQACVGNGTTGNATGGCAVQVSQSGLN